MRRKGGCAPRKKRKLALGTMMFTVPPVLLILIGPSLIMVMRSLSRFLG